MPSPKSSRIRLAIAGLSLGFLLAPLAVASPVDAETDRDRATAAVDRVADRDVKPVTDRRPDHRIERLSMKCGIIDGPSDVRPDIRPDVRPEVKRVHIGCKWRPANHPKAVGYQLWRIVDRGEREGVARGGLDFLGHKDVVSSEAHLVRYAVISVDENGRRVGQSRVQRVWIHRPVRDRITDARVH